MVGENKKRGKAVVVKHGWSLPESLTEQTGAEKRYGWRK